MKLSDIVNQFRRRSSEGTNFVRNPVSVLRRHGRKFAEGWYREAEVGGDKKIPGVSGKKKKKKGDSLEQKLRKRMPFQRKDSAASTQSTTQAFAETGFQNPHQEYQQPYQAGYANSASRNGALDPAHYAIDDAVADRRVIGAAGTLTTLPTLPETDTPAILSEGEVLKGTWWGRYTVGTCEQVSSRTRRYTGFQNNGNHPVWIYEYQLLESDFNQSDADTRRHAFKELIDLNLRLGSDRDFRIVKLQDVVASIDRRCFLITQAIPKAQVLSDYLAQAGPLTPQQVHRILHQCLQTLQYLHSSFRVRWPDNTTERGLYHGNLSLDSLWIHQLETTVGVKDPQLFVYFSNFSLWEHLFSAPSDRTYRNHVARGIVELGSISEDLTDLGTLAFQLLAGGKTNPYTQQPYDPQNPEDWPDALQYHPLQDFIYRLIGIGSKQRFQQPFNSAGTALTALRNVATDYIPTPPPKNYAEAEPVEQSGVARRWIILAIALGGLLGILGIRPLLSLLTNNSPAQAAVDCEGPCRLQSITDLPSKPITYGLETGGSWEISFNRAEAWPTANSSLATTGANSPNWEATLETRVAEVGETSLALDLGLKSANTSELYEAMTAGDIQFALMRPAAELPAGFTATVVAYDGIVAVVPYSDATRKNNIARRLDGKISLEALQDIFTGKSMELNGQPIEPYFPLNPSINREQKTVRFSNESAAIAPFKTLLFSNLTTEQSTAQIKNFESVQESAEAALKQTIEADWNRNQNSLRYDMFAHMFRDFEQALATSPEAVPVSIGFEQLSRAFGQCSVYPLAIVHQKKAVQPFYQSNGRFSAPIGLKTNLCDDKGSYWPNVEAFENGDYPLAYSLAVVYPKASAEAGEAIAQLLKTAEGQYLLSESGLVPTLPIPAIRTLLWGTPSN